DADRTSRPSSAPRARLATLRCRAGTYSRPGNVRAPATRPAPLPNPSRRTGAAASHSAAAPGSRVSPRGMRPPARLSRSSRITAPLVAASRAAIVGLDVLIIRGELGRRLYVTRHDLGFLRELIEHRLYRR